MLAMLNETFFCDFHISCLIFKILIISAEAPIHSVGYQSLVGNNEHSWGWDLGRNKVYHNSKVHPGITYPSNLKHDETFVVPDKFLGKIWRKTIRIPNLFVEFFQLCLTWTKACSGSSLTANIWDLLSEIFEAKSSTWWSRLFGDIVKLQWNI